MVQIFPAQQSISQYRDCFKYLPSLTQALICGSKRSCRCKCNHCTIPVWTWDFPRFCAVCAAHAGAGSAAQCCHLDCFPFIPFHFAFIPSCLFHALITSLVLPNNKMLILVSCFLFLPSLFSGKCGRNKKEALIHSFTFYPEAFDFTS